jgi:guanosine-3',5'-bis(diphosphate) 3'-pyrophosphohydrolase
MSVLTERAKWFARFIHEGEFIRNGDPYYTHCDAVEEGVSIMDENTRCAAQMHDTKENYKDPDFVMKVIEENFPPEVAHLVETLTHDKNIYYTRYIDVVCNNPKALAIKISDMIHNTKDVDVPEKQLDKYREACLLMIARGKYIPTSLRERLKIEDEKIQA